MDFQFDSMCVKVAIIERVTYRGLMTHTWYALAKKLFADHAGLTSEIMRELLDVDIPPGLPETVLAPLAADDCGNLTDGAQPDTPATVVLVGHPGNPLRAIVLQFQDGKDDAIRQRWPRGVMAVWLHHGCPVDLLVICPDNETARWHAEPIDTTMPGYVCSPRAISATRLQALLPMNGA
jgi:hypothetical protein